jgi:hypothetical protein
MKPKSQYKLKRRHIMLSEDTWAELVCLAKQVTIRKRERISVSALVRIMIENDLNDRRANEF